MGEEERREQGEAMAQVKTHQEEVPAAGAFGGGEPAVDGGGFLSAMASKIGATMSGANGSGGEVNAAVASGGEEGKRDSNGEPVEEGGFLSAMASKIGAAMSGANGGSGDDSGDNAAVASDFEHKEKEDGSGGGGGIFHKLLSSSPPASSPASEAMEAEEVRGEEKGQDATGEQAGILSSMASKIGKAMSAANGNGNHSTRDDNHGGSGDHAKASNGNAIDGSKCEENGGGILSAMASKISMAVSGANGNRNHNTEGDAKKGTGDAVHGSKGEEMEKGHDANGGRIVEQIISNLPSDDQAPDADEASLLIAIIED